MSHDLFDDVVIRRSSTSSRRSWVVVISVVAHAAAIVVLLVVPLMAAGVLPVPRGPINFFVESNVVPIVVVPAPERIAVRRDEPQGPTRVDVVGELAPVDAPTGIHAEDPLTSGTGPFLLPGVGAIEHLPGLGAPIVLVPPPVVPIAPVRLHDGIQPPQKVVDAQPVYPAVAQQAHVQGIVVIEATIDIRGNVTAARVIKSVPLLDQAALDAVKQWKYTAALLNHAAVPVIMTVTVNFTLNRW